MFPPGCSHGFTLLPTSLIMPTITLTAVTFCFPSIILIQLAKSMACSSVRHSVDKWNLSWYKCDPNKAENGYKGCFITFTRHDTHLMRLVFEWYHPLVQWVKILYQLRSNSPQPWYSSCQKSLNNAVLRHLVRYKWTKPGITINSAV